MATLPELRPNGTQGTPTIIWTNTGADTALWEAIDDDPDSPDSLDYCENDGQNDGSGVVDLTTVPGDFSNMDTCLIAAYFTSNGSRSDDDIVIYVKITNAAEDTNYMDEVEIARWDSGGAETGLRTAGSITSAGQSASESDWNGARLHIRYDCIKLKGWDTINLRIDAIEIRGTYTAGVTPALDQDSFQIYNDDGLANAGTLLVPVNNNARVYEGQTVRIRFVIQETAGADPAATGFYLYYSKNGGGYTQVTTSSSDIRATASTAGSPPTDEDATTQRVGSGSFVTGRWSDDDEAGEAGIDLTGSDETEVEWCLTPQAGDLTQDDYIDLRVRYDDTTVLDTYTNTPRLTINEVPTSEAFARWAIDAADTGGGTQQITTSNLGGETPDAMVVFASLATGAGWGNIAAHAQISVGATDGTNEVVSSTYAEDNVDFSDTARRHGDTGVINLVDPTDGSTVLAAASFSQWVTNGVELTWDVTPADTYAITILFFAGSGISVAGGTFDPNDTQDGTATITTGFETNILFLFASSAGFDENWYANLQQTFGFMTYDDPTITQGNMQHYIADNEDTTNNDGMINNNRVGGYGIASLVSSFEVTAVSSTQVTITTRDGACAAAYRMAYLAINLPSDIRASIEFETTPAATGSWLVSGFGLKPQAVIGLGGNYTAWNTYRTSSAEAGGFGVFGFDEDGVDCTQTICNSENVGTTDTESLQVDLIEWFTDAGGTGFEAAYTAMDVEGFEVNVVDYGAGSLMMPVLAMEYTTASMGAVGQPTQSRTFGIPTGSGRRDRIGGLN